MPEDKKAFDPSMFKSLEELSADFPEEADNYMPLDGGGFVKKSVLDTNSARNESMASTVNPRGEIAHVLKENPEGLHAGFYDAQAHKLMSFGTVIGLLEDIGPGELNGELAGEVSRLVKQTVGKSRELCDGVKSGTIYSIELLEQKLSEIIIVSHELTEKASELLAQLPENIGYLRDILPRMIENSFIEIYENIYFAISEKPSSNITALSREINLIVNPYLSATDGNALLSVQEIDLYQLIVDGRQSGRSNHEDIERYAEFTVWLNRDYDGSLSRFLNDHGFSVVIDIPETVGVNEVVWKGVLKSAIVKNLFFAALKQSTDTGKTGEFNGFFHISVVGDDDNRELVIRYGVNTDEEKERIASMDTHSIEMPEAGDEKWVPYSRRLVYDKIGKKYSEPFVPKLNKENGKTVAEVKVPFV